MTKPSLRLASTNLLTLLDAKLAEPHGLDVAHAVTELASATCMYIDQVLDYLERDDSTHPPPRAADTDRPPADPTLVTCTTCYGTGRRTIVTSESPHGYPATCDACYGVGAL